MVPRCLRRGCGYAKRRGPLYDSRCNCSQSVVYVNNKYRLLARAGASVLLVAIRGEMFSESGKSKPNLDCSYYSPINLAPIGVPFGAKSIGEW